MWQQHPYRYQRITTKASNARNVLLLYDSLDSEIPKTPTYYIQVMASVLGYST